MGIAIRIGSLTIGGRGFVSAPSLIPQYREFNNVLVEVSTPLLYTDGITSVRWRISGGYLYLDITATPTGFAGVENIDWEWVSRYRGAIALTEYRHGVRGGVFVIDTPITGTKYAGVEDTDWENLFTRDGAGAEVLFREGVYDGGYILQKWGGATWETILTQKSGL